MRHTILPLAVLVPAVAFATGWESLPTNWLPSELQWALPLAPAGTTPADLLETVDAPPRAAWCGPNGAWRQPSAIECDAYDVNLEGWVSDLHDDAAQIPAFQYPPTYCGGC